jgi:CubicO group peptidase (beta-lactamase class C family)
VITLALALASLQASIAVAAPLESYLQFDGLDDRVTVPDSASLDITDAITLEAWIRPDTISSTADQNRIVSKNSNVELMISTGDTGCSDRTNGHVQWRTTIAGSNKRICGGTLVPGVWHHLAATYDGAQVALYVNGALVASAPRVGPITPNNAALALGNHPTNTRAYDGALDEVRVWNRALTQGEIQAQMNLDLAGSEVGLVAWYRLDEGAGQTAFDGTLQGNHGRLGSTTDADSWDPQWVQSGAPQNQPPTVNAGPDRTIAFPTWSLALDGSVGDDGFPNGVLLTAWTQVSGPAAMSFADAGAVDTTASFFAEGVYVLRLAADDTEFLASDDLVVTVRATPQLASIVVTPDPAVLAPGAQQQFHAAGFDESGNPFAIDPEWSAQGGSISASGLYTAGASPGPFTVRATDGAIAGSAAVLVRDATQVWPTQGWPTATPAEMGMDAAKLDQARSYALGAGGSGVITRDGRLVMSWGSLTQLYDVKSVTKSFGSSLLALAIQDGLVALSDPVQQHLPEVGLPPDTNLATGWLDEITVVQLATHSAGFDKAGGFIALLARPGTTWIYSDGGANWLADTLTVRFGQDLNTVLFNRVLQHLGIGAADYKWRKNKYRSTTLAGLMRREFGAGISMNVDDLARFGYLFLRSGQWEDRVILPASFVAAASVPAPQIAGLPVQNDGKRFANAPAHYGLLWWNNADGSIAGVPRDAFWAWGIGDHLIVVIPSLDVVAVRAGPEWSASHSPSYYNAIAPFIRPIAESVAQP